MTSTGLITQLHWALWLLHMRAGTFRLPDAITEERRRLSLICGLIRNLLTSLIFLHHYCYF